MSTVIYILAFIGLLNVIGGLVFMFMVWMEQRND